MEREGPHSHTQTATIRDTRGSQVRGAAARGDDIGRYLVVGEIGVGGLGQVVRGYDPDLNREVAIKLVREDIRDRGDLASTLRSRRRLLREAQAIARLSHPNVVAVYEVDEHEGDVFIAMEYVRGLSLRDWLTEDRDREPILDVFMQAGRGLAAAHSVGLVHRDFKPSNVLVGDDGRVRVLDFGLARAYGAPADPEQRSDLVSSPNDTVTVAGAVVGTPAYMAPEQLRGADVDARADQFAFCLSLYEALTGDRPAIPRDGAPLSLTRVARLPRHLVGPIRRALAVDPDERFPNMESLLERIPPPARRSGALVATVALLGLAALGSVTLSRSAASAPDCSSAGGEDAVWNESVKQQLRSKFAHAGGVEDPEASFGPFAKQVDRYKTAIRTMRVDNCRATRSRGEQSRELMDLRSSCLAQRTAELGALLVLLSDAPGAALVARTPDMLYRLPGLDACRNAARLMSAVPLPRGAASETMAASINRTLAQVRARIAAGQYPDAAALATSAVDEARRLAHAPTLARGLLLRGEALDGQEKGKDAEASLRDAALAADRGRDDATRAAAYTVLINAVGVLQERKAEGASLAAFAAGAADRLDSDELRAAVAARTARFHWWHGAFDDALAHARTSVDIATRAFGPRDVRTGDAQWVLGVVHSERREHKDARTHLDLAHDIYLRALGPNHLKVGRALNSLAIVHFDLQQPEESEAKYRRALEVFRRGKAPPLRQAMTVMNLGNNLSSRGSHKKALIEYARAEEVIVTSVGRSHSRYADVLQNKASALSKLGRHDEALQTLDVAIKIRLEKFGSKHPITAATLRTIGNAHLRAGNHDKALTKFLESVKVLEAAGGADNKMLLRSLVDIGELQLNHSKLADARKTLVRTEAISKAHPDSHTPALRGNIPDFLSEVLWRLGDRTAARAAAKRALVHYREAKRQDHIQRVEAFLLTGKLAPR